MNIENNEYHSKYFNKKPLTFSKLNEYASSIENAAYRNLGEHSFYYWIQDKSTRGFSVNTEKNIL